MQFRPEPNGSADAEEDRTNECHEFKADVCQKHDVLYPAIIRRTFEVESPKRNRRGWVVGVAATVIVLRIGWGASAEPLFYQNPMRLATPFQAFYIRNYSHPKNSSVSAVFLEKCPSAHSFILT